MCKYTRLTFGSAALIISSLFIFNCTSSSTNFKDTPQSGLSVTTPQLKKVNLVTGLQEPWDLAFLPDGTLLYTEKCLGLSMRTTSGQTAHIFGVGPGTLVTAPDLFCQGQSGMNGVAVDPDFQTNRSVYVFMASNLSDPPTNRVVRLTVNADATSVTRTDIVTDIPFKAEANSWGDAGLHSGGRLRFGPDGFLYITTGDNHNGTLPQDLHSLGGKVLRVDRNGQGAPGNGTPAGSDPRIFTYGHRNVQGICFQPGTGKAYIAEHGPEHSDEVTLISAGGNGGWDPKPDPGVTCQDNYCGYISNNLQGTPTSMTDLKKFPNAMKPLLSLDDSQGLGPCTFLSAPKWKAWNQTMIIGIMGGMRVDVLKISADGALQEKVTAQLPAARIRSTVQGTDGNLYIATDTGEIWKISPAI